MNTQRRASKNVKVRQAIEYAVDKRAFQLAAGGTQGGDLATTLITPGIPGRQDYDLYPAPASGDVAKAKQLLAQAGATEPAAHPGQRQRQHRRSTRRRRSSRAWSASGSRSRSTRRTSNTYYDTITGDKGDYDLTVSSWQPDFPSANGNISPLFDSSQIGGGGYNISRYSNPAVDQLIAQATGEVDQAKAQQDWAAGRQADHAGRARRPAALHPQRVPARWRTSRTSTSRASRPTRTTCGSRWARRVTAC